MSMKEKLMEIIQNSVGGCAKHWAEVIADGLIANGVTVQEWSSVDDRLPETVGKYLVCTAEGHDDPVGEEGECGMGIKCESVKNAKAEVAREILEEIDTIKKEYASGDIDGKELFARLYMLEIKYTKENKS